MLRGMLLYCSWQLLFQPTCFANLPTTEAEESDFDIGDLPLLDSKGVKKLKKLLSDPSFSILGKWRKNESLLQDMNRRLVNGGFFLIDGFFQADFAEGLQEDMEGLAADGHLVTESTAISFPATGVDEEAYFGAKSPAELCKVLNGTAFKYRHHDFSMDRMTPERLGLAEKVATLFIVLKGGEKWREAMNLLITGSGMRVQNGVATRTSAGIAFREWMEGDYSLLHNDGADQRALSVNYWLGNPGWKRTWGGNFLWCGDMLDSDLRDAVSLPPKYNQAMIFLPHSLTMHSVEVVRAAKGKGNHRFSFTSWLRIEDMDTARHYEVLMKKQADAKKKAKASAALLASNQCDPKKGCNVCSTCCKMWIPNGANCDLCVKLECTASLSDHAEEL